jgi:hypothetical protein
LRVAEPTECLYMFGVCGVPSESSDRICQVLVLRRGSLRRTGVQPHVPENGQIL